MALNNRGLGRGIDALFEGNGSSSTALASDSPLQTLSIDAIKPNPEQPRKEFDPQALDDLAQSIKRHGILQPLLVRPTNDSNVYSLVAGERRLKAAKLAGLSQVPAIVRDMDENEALIATLLENLQREDLNPIEEARGLENLRQALNITQEGLAETLGKPRSSVGNTLRLLKLPQPVQKELAEGRLSPSHAKLLLGMGDEQAISSLCSQIVDKHISIRDTEKIINIWNETKCFPWEDIEPKRTEKKPRPASDPNILKLANDIAATLHCRAKINGNQEKGRISLVYESNEQLFELLNKLGMTLHP